MFLVRFIKFWRIRFLFHYKWKNFMTWKLWVFYLKNKSYFCNSAAYVILFLYTYTVNLNLLWIKQDEKHEIWAEDIYFLNLYCLTYIHFNSMIFNRSIHCRSKKYAQREICVYTQLQKYFEINRLLQRKRDTQKMKKKCQCARVFYLTCFQLPT